jgi:hypothetical protein
MRDRGSTKRWIFLSTALLLLVGVGSTAWSQSSERYQQQADQFETMLDEAAESPGADKATEDIEQTKKWLSDARVLLANGKEDDGAILLRRVKFSLELVNALVTAGNIHSAADDQEAAYHRAKETELPELEDEIRELKSERAKLKNELNRLK